MLYQQTQIRRQKLQWGVTRTVINRQLQKKFEFTDVFDWTSARKFFDRPCHEGEDDCISDIPRMPAAGLGNYLSEVMCSLHNYVGRH